MVASGSGLRDLVPDPPGGLLGVEEAITLALEASRARRFRSTPWTIPITSPTPIPRGPAGTRCASGGWPAR